MIRESKMTVKQAHPNYCDVYCESRDDNGPWEKQGITSIFGTVEMVVAERIAAQERWGWTLREVEDSNTLTFWKEF